MTSNRITIIGGGNMGTAVLQSLLRLPGISAQQVTVVEHSARRRKELHSRFSVHSAPNLSSSILEHFTVALIAVKPQDFPAVASEIQLSFPKTGLLISIMAGVRTSTLHMATGCSHIVRVMPNLPMIVGRGFSAWYATRAVSRQQKTFTRLLFAAGGEQVEIHNEKKFDAITAISGSGPAYLFSFAADLMRAAKQLGLPATMAKQLVLQTIKGSIALLEGSTDSPEVWHKRVTSKGGTTEAAFRVLQKAHLDKLWLKAIRAAAQRSYSISIFLDGVLRK